MCHLSLGFQSRFIHASKFSVMVGWVSEAQGTRGAFHPVIPYLLSKPMFDPVAMCNTLSPKYYSFIRLLSSPRFKRTLLCFWIHGRQSIPSHQSSKGTCPRRRSCLFHLQSNRIRSGSHSCKWLLSKGYETRNEQLASSITHPYHR